jgi:hypothetical protein
VSDFTLSSTQAGIKDYLGDEVTLIQSSGVITPNLKEEVWYGRTRLIRTYRSIFAFDNVSGQRRTA